MTRSKKGPASTRVADRASRYPRARWAKQSGIIRRATWALEPRVQGEHPRVLLVEDDPLLRSTLSRDLRRRGCLVETAADGHAALARWNAAPFELVLSDWKMPRVDGVELLCRLVDDGALRMARLFLMTGSDPASAALDRLRRHGIAVLPKPLDDTTMRALAGPMVVGSPDAGEAQLLEG